MRKMRKNTIPGPLLQETRQCHQGLLQNKKETVSCHQQYPLKLPAHKTSRLISTTTFRLKQSSSGWYFYLFIS